MAENGKIAVDGHNGDLKGIRPSNRKSSRLTRTPVRDKRPAQHIAPQGSARVDRSSDEQRFLTGLLQIMDCGLIQAARNMVWHRLMSARIE